MSRVVFISRMIALVFHIFIAVFFSVSLLSFAVLYQNGHFQV